MISNYTSSNLDLTDYNNYWNLSLPVNALNETRLKMLIEAFYSFMNQRTNVYLKSFFSYLLYISMNSFHLKVLILFIIKFQQIHIEKTWKYFNSIYQNWEKVTNGYLSDFPEVISEFFFLPDFLVSTNSINLGIDSKANKIINDIEILNWAKSVYNFT